MLVSAIGIPLTTLTIGIRGVIEAYEDFKGISLLRIILGVANFALPVLSFLLFGKSLTLMVATLIVARFFVLIGHLAILNHKLPKDWFKGGLNFTNVSGLFSFGAWMTVSNIISPLMVTADRFVVSGILGAGAVAYYTVPSEIIMRVLLLPAAFTSALFPRFASTLIADVILAKSLYRHSLKLVIFTLAPICIVIAVFSHYFLSLWMGAVFAEKSWLIMSVMSLGIFFNGIAYIPFSKIQASGNSRITAIFHLLEFIIYVPVLFIFINLYGLVGASIAWVFRVALDLIFLLIYVERYCFSEKSSNEAL